MKILTNEQGLVAMKMHYSGKIVEECNNVEFRRSIGIAPTEESVSKTNEKLYRLFMFRNNINDILNGIYEEDFE